MFFHRGGGLELYRSVITMYQWWYYIKSLHSATADLLFSVQIFKNVEGSSIFLSLKVCFLYLILLGKKPKFLKKVEMYLNE